MRKLDRILSSLALGLLFLVLLPQVFGHAPLMPGNNENLAAATVVSDPTKSWAIYGKLHEGGEAQYYRFDISQGQTIHVSLLKSTRPEEKSFVPGFVLMGPSLVSQGTVPDYVEVPGGAGNVVVDGKTPSQATYEAFSPSAFYQLADLELGAPASGTYYVAVFEPSRGGHYGLAIGDRESFTLAEWTLAPLNFISIYQWEGESLASIFVPAALTLAVGIVFLIFRRRNAESPRTFFQWTGAVAGLLFLASGFTVISQMLFALSRASAGADVIITIIFALAPIVLGILIIRFALRPNVNIRTRTSMAILGLIGLFVWAGFVVGPILAILASVLPHTEGTTASSGSMN